MFSSETRPILRSSTPIEFIDGQFLVLGEANRYLNLLAPLITLATVTQEERLDNEELVKLAIKEDLSERKMYISKIDGIADSNDNYQINYVYEDPASVHDNTRKASSYIERAIHDARLFFPFTDRIHLRCFVIPVEEQKKIENALKYRPIFKKTYGLLNRRGLASSDLGDSYIFCFPFSEVQNQLTFSHETDIESSFDANLNDQIRHEVTHVIQGSRAGDSDFATEGIAMLVRDLHASSVDVHARVSQHDINLPLLVEIANKRDFEGYTESQYTLYDVSHSLFRFLYDFFDQDANKFGVMLDKMRDPDRLSLSEAFEDVFGIPFEKMAEMWEHEIFRSESIRD